MYSESLAGKIGLPDPHGVADTLMNLTPLFQVYTLDDSKASEMVALLGEVGNRFSDRLSEDLRRRLESLDASSDLALLVSGCAVEMIDRLGAKFYLAKALLERARLLLAGVTFTWTQNL